MPAMSLPSEPTPSIDDARRTVTWFLENWPADPPWGERPALVLIPSRDAESPEPPALGQRFPDLDFGERQCLVIDLGGYSRPHLGLRGHRMGEGFEAALILTENWAALADDGALFGTVRDRPDRFEVRIVDYATRTTILQGWQPRHRPGAWDALSASPMPHSANEAHLATFVGQSVAPVAMEPGAIVGSIMLRAVAERLVIEASDHWDRNEATERLVRVMDSVADEGVPGRPGAEPLTIEEILGHPVSWEDLRRLAARGALKAVDPDTAAWMDADALSHILAQAYGTPEEGAMAIASLAGVDLARLALMSWSPTVDTTEFDSSRLFYRVPKRGVGADLAPLEEGWPTTLFGVPLTEPHAAFLDEMEGSVESVRSSILGSLGVLTLDRALVKTANRNSSALRKPGDIAALRMAVANTELVTALPLLSSPTKWGELMDDDPNRPSMARSLATLRSTAMSRGTRYARMAKAVPYFIDAPTAQQVAGAHLPKADFLDFLRLPFPSIMVAFDQDLAFDDVVQEHVDPLAGADPHLTSRLAGSVYGLCGGWGTALGMLARHGGGLSAVVLFADDDHRLREWVLWIITTNNDPRDPSRRQRHTWAVWGHLPHSQLSHVAYNLAAYACWGSWAPPRDLPLPSPGSHREWRKAVRTSQFRKGEPRGAAIGVHVVQVTPPLASRPGGGPGPSRSVRGHLRRGFWRRSRVRLFDDRGRSRARSTGPGRCSGSPSPTRTTSSLRSPSKADPSVSDWTSTGFLSLPRRSRTCPWSC